MFSRKSLQENTHVILLLSAISNNKNSQKNIQKIAVFPNSDHTHPKYTLLLILSFLLLIHETSLIC